MFILCTSDSKKFVPNKKEWWDIIYVNHTYVIAIKSKISNDVGVVDIDCIPPFLFLFGTNFLLSLVE